MPRDSIGIIFGTTSSLNFNFAVSDSTAVKRMDYVKVWHESDGWTLAQVVNITRTSDAFQLDNAVVAATGGNIGEVREKIVADVSVIGSRGTDGLLRAPKTPFSPGDKVFSADSDLIKQTLGLGQGDVYMGMLDGQDISVYLDSTHLVQKHCSILAMTGSGKSYTAGVIMEELLEKRIPLVIIDPHGEYSSLRFPNAENSEAFEHYKVKPKGYLQQVTVYTPANKALNPEADALFRLNGINLSADDLAQMFSEDRSQSQVGVLFEAIAKLRAEKERYTLNDIIFEVAQNKSKIKWNVIHHLENIKETELLSENPTGIGDLVQPGRASILHMKGVNPNIQSMIVARLCNNLFEARKLNKIPPCMLIVEEAHNFCPEKGFEKTVSTDIMRTIASEGRKFGLGLMVISQRPARVDKNVLSQCNTQIIMKMTNPNDLKAISKGIEGISSEVEEELKRLPPGVAMIVSGKIARPVLVSVRVRRTKHGGESAAVIPMTRMAPPPGLKEPVKALEPPVMPVQAPAVPVKTVIPAKPQDKPQKPKKEEKKEADSLLTKLFGKKR